MMLESPSGRQAARLLAGSGGMLGASDGGKMLATAPRRFGSCSPWWAGGAKWSADPASETRAPSGALADDATDTLASRSGPASVKGAVSATLPAAGAGLATLADPPACKLRRLPAPLATEASDGVPRSDPARCELCTLSAALLVSGGASSSLPSSVPMAVGNKAIFSPSAALPALVAAGSGIAGRWKADVPSTAGLATGSNKASSGCPPCALTAGLTAATAGAATRGAGLDTSPFSTSSATFEAARPSNSMGCPPRRPSVGPLLSGTVPVGKPSGSAPRSVSAGPKLAVSGLAASSSSAISRPSVPSNAAWGSAGSERAPCCGAFPLPAAEVPPGVRSITALAHALGSAAVGCVAGAKSCRASCKLRMVSSKSE